MGHPHLRSRLDPKRERPRWHGHAIQLRRWTGGGSQRQQCVLIFQGSLTQILEWIKRKPAVKRGRIWIEDVAEPAHIDYRHTRSGHRDLLDTWASAMFGMFLSLRYVESISD